MVNTVNVPAQHQWFLISSCLSSQRSWRRKKEEEEEVKEVQRRKKKKQHTRVSCLKVKQLPHSSSDVHLFFSPWSSLKFFSGSLCFSKLLIITFGSSRTFSSFQNTRNNFPAARPPAARWLTWLRRFLSPFYLSLLFTDLIEAETEEALELGKINTDQTTHNPSAISAGEPVTLSVCIMTDDRNVLLVFNLSQQFCFFYFSWRQSLSLTSSSWKFQPQSNWCMLG